MHSADERPSDGQGEIESYNAREECDMIDVKEATQIALDYFQDIYSDQSFSNVLLEEVERAQEDDSSYWWITIGFTEDRQTGPFAQLPSSRRYKRFKIDAETGEVLAMKIRSVENA